MSLYCQSARFLLCFLLWSYGTVQSNAFDTVLSNFLDYKLRRRQISLSEPFWNTTDKQIILDMHNDYRSQTALGNTADDGTSGFYDTASNMNSLFWDPALAALAQAHAETCIYGHNDDRVTQFYSTYASQATFEYPSSATYLLGENVAYSAGSPTYGYFTYDYALKGRVDAWFEENTLYHYGSYVSGLGIGHFTQMVWADTRYVGCGWAVCPDSSYDYKYILVCDYYPFGNNGNNYIYTSGDNYATCDADRTVNAEGLCAGCMSSSFTVDSTATTADDCCDGLGRCVDDSALDTMCTSCPGTVDTATSAPDTPVTSLEGTNDVPTTTTAATTEEGYSCSDNNAFVGYQDVYATVSVTGEGLYWLCNSVNWETSWQTMFDDSTEVTLDINLDDGCESVDGTETIDDTATYEMAINVEAYAHDNTGVTVLTNVMNDTNAQIAGVTYWTNLGVSVEVTTDAYVDCSTEGNDDAATFLSISVWVYAVIAALALFSLF